jgi:hypothetical protein
MQQGPSDSKQGRQCIGKVLFFMSIGVADYEKDGRTRWMKESPTSEEQKHVFAMFYEQKRGGHRKCIAATNIYNFHMSNSHRVLALYTCASLLSDATCKHLLLPSIQHDKHRQLESVAETRLFQHVVAPTFTRSRWPLGHHEHRRRKHAHATPSSPDCC